MAGLGKWIKNLKGMMNDPWDHPGDSDHPDCPDCGARMNFYGHDDDGDFPIGDGYWSCPSCGFKITEDELD